MIIPYYPFLAFTLQNIVNIVYIVHRHQLLPVSTNHRASRQLVSRVVLDLASGFGGSSKTVKLNFNFRTSEGPKQCRNYLRGIRGISPPYQINFLNFQPYDVRKKVQYITLSPPLLVVSPPTLILQLRHWAQDRKKNFIFCSKVDPCILLEVNKIQKCYVFFQQLLAFLISKNHCSHCPTASPLFMLGHAINDRRMHDLTTSSNQRDVLNPGIKHCVCFIYII